MTASFEISLTTHPDLRGNYVLAGQSNKRQNNSEVALPILK